MDSRMLSYIKHLTKHSFNYSLAEILTKGAGFFLIPIYTRFLTPDDFGIITIIRAISNVVIVIYLMGQIASLQKFYFEYKNDPKKLKDYLGTIIISLFCFILICTLLLQLFGNSLFPIIAKNVPFKPYLQIVLCTLFLTPLFRFWHRLFQVRERSSLYSLISIAEFWIKISLTLYFIIILKQGALGMIKAFCCSAFIFFIIAIGGVFKEVNFTINFPMLKESLKYGMPIVPHSLSGWVIGLSDRLILGHYTDLSNVGIYGIGYTIGSAMEIIVVAINLAYVPFFMSTATDKGEEAKNIFSRLSTYYIMAILFIATCISIFAKEVIVLMTVKSYYSAFKIVPIIAFSYMISGMYHLVAKPIFYVKTATKYLPIASFGSAIINLILNYLLIPKYDQMGAAYATLISFLASFLFTWVISYKVYPIKFEYKKIILIFSAIIPTLLVGLSLEMLNLNILPSILIKFTLLLLYPILLLSFGVLQWNQIIILKNGLIKRKKMA